MHSFATIRLDNEHWATPVSALGMNVRLVLLGLGIDKRKNGNQTATDIGYSPVTRVSSAQFSIGCLPIQFPQLPYHQTLWAGSFGPILVRPRPSAAGTDDDGNLGHCHW